MVRVLCCHHFAGQDVFNTDHEPLTVYTSGHWLFVASVHCCIHVHDLNQQRCPCFVLVPTIAVPKQILHCQKGNYIAAIEEKYTRHSSTPVVSLRVYLQWEKASSDAPKRMNFAGRISRASSDGLEIIEVSMNSYDPVFIACCIATGNLAVAVHKQVKIYHLVEHRDSEGLLYRDLEPVLDIRFSMLVKQVSLCEEFVAVCSSSEVHVVRLRDRDLPSAQGVSPNGEETAVNKTLDFATKDNVETDILKDMDFVSWDCVKNESPSQYNAQGQPNTILLETKKVLDSKTTAADVEILGPTGHEVLGHPITIWCDGCVMQETPVTTYLYRRFALRDEHDCLHSLQFVPLYKPDEQQGGDVTDEGNPSILQSSRRSQLIGLCVFCSTTGVGTLYNILNTSEMLASYAYTSQTTQVAANNGLIFAITKNGLEIYTSRGYTKAVHNITTFDDVTETCPSTTLDTCLIGMQPFMVVQSMAVTGSHLVVMSKVTASKTGNVNSSIYALKNCSTEELVKDMLSLGRRHHSSSPPAYLQLVQEAHLCLRGYRLDHGDNKMDIRKLFSENCAILGDYYASCESKEDRKLALPYYMMTGYTTQQIVTRLGTQQMTKQSVTPLLPTGFTPLYSPGIIHYLNYVMFNEATLVQLNADCADKVLDIYHILQPTALPNVILKSHLTGYSYEKAIAVLQSVGQRQNPMVSLALALLYLKDGQFTSAESVLFANDERDLIAVCLENHHLLHIDFKELTPLSQLIKKHKPGTFAAIWSSVYGQQLMGLDAVISLLESGSHKKEIYRNFHLMLFLEGVLTDGLNKSTSAVLSDISELLSSIYLQRLLEACDQFGRVSSSSVKTFLVRHSWLNELPPFCGEAPSDRCIHLKGNMKSRAPSMPKRMPAHNVPSRQESHALCACWLCNQDLVKLQAVLSSNLVSPEVARKMLAVLNTTEVPGVESLEIVCMLVISVDSAIDLIVDKYPRILVKFVSETLASSGIDHWSRLIENLSCLLKETQPNDHNDSTMVHVEAFRGVLSIMSDILPPGDFLRLLPPDVSLGFALPSVRKSIHRHLASKLKREMKSLD